MKMKQYDQFWLGREYTVALEYGDYTGLEDWEESRFLAFLKSLKPCSTFHYSEKTELQLDMVTGLMSECRLVTAYAPTNEA